MPYLNKKMLPALMLASLIGLGSCGQTDETEPGAIELKGSVVGWNAAAASEIQRLDFQQMLTGSISTVSTGQVVDSLTGEYVVKINFSQGQQTDQILGYFNCPNLNNTIMQIEGHNSLIEMIEPANTGSRHRTVLVSRNGQRGGYIFSTATTKISVTSTCISGMQTLSLSVDMNLIPGWQAYVVNVNAHGDMSLTSIGSANVNDLRLAVWSSAGQ